MKNRRALGLPLLIASLCAVIASLIGAPAAQAGAAPAGVAQRAICGNWKGAVAGYGKWLTSTSECSVFGATSTPAKPAKWGYSWSTAAGSNGRICVEGLGYVYSKKAKETVAKWYSLGCGTSGGGTVPWRGKPHKVNGKTYYYGVAATPKVRAKVQLGFLGGAYRWKG